MRGRVFTGVGEGARYVSLPPYKEAFKRKLGFDPYPGTLNVRVLPEYVPLLKKLKSSGHFIPRFIVDGIEYGWVRCVPARVGDYPAAVLVIEKTVHGPDVLEIIAPVRLRDALGLKDGDEIEIEIEIECDA